LLETIDPRDPILTIVVPGRATDQQALVIAKEQTPTLEGTSSNPIKLYEKVKPWLRSKKGSSLASLMNILSKEYITHQCWVSYTL